jgi:hypothetical protein
MTGKQLQKIVKAYVSVTRLGKEKLAVGADVSWRTIDDVVRTAKLPKEQNVNAILSFLEKQQHKPTDAA